MQSRKTFLILAGALFMSLVVNFYTIGSMLGRQTHSYFGKHGSEEWKERREKMMQVLSETDRAIMRQEMEKNRDRFRKARAQMEQAKREVGRAMQAEPFSQESLDRAVEKEAAQKRLFLRLILETRKTAEQKMSPEGRAALQKIRPEGGKASLSSRMK